MKISVLVVSYNCKQYIRQCLKSIYNNKHTDWELLVLDDHSIDDTRTVIKSFVKRNDKRIKFIQSSRKLYCGAAFKFLSSFATGNVVAIVDGDDQITEDALQIVDTAYTKYPQLDYIYTQHYTCNTDLSRKKTGISSLPIEGCDLTTSWENNKHCFSHMRTCRRSMLKYEIFNPKLKFSVDKYMGMMLESHGCGGFLNIITYYYRTRPLQLTSLYRSSRNLVKKQIITSIREYRSKMKILPKYIIEIFI